MVTIWDFRCSMCGYIDINSTENIVSCPVCSSTHIEKITKIRLKEDKYSLSIKEIYCLLDNILGLSVIEQEKIRKILRESGGVHILCLNKQKGSLRETVTKNEAEGYLSLVRHQNFGLAFISHSIVAISPDSPIRSHVGVNRLMLKDLEDIVRKEIQL